MFQFFDMILSPFRWLVSVILIGFHEAFNFIGLSGSSGWNWTLSIVGLVVVIRAALIPLFVKQIKAQRGMQELQPELLALQKKYKGKTDQLSRQAMAQEQMALYKKHGTNPFSACLPLIVQMPFFFSLFTVLNGIGNAASNKNQIGALSPQQVQQFDAASIFGAPLSSTFLNNGGNSVVIVLSIVMILAMTASQFITQRQIMAKNMSDQALASPFMRQQKMLLYVLPLVFAVGGINFPIGVLIYWTATNVWTMVQQFVVIRNMPTPGSPAYRAWQERQRARGKLEPTARSSGATVATTDEDSQPRGQRTQPQRKNRRKR
ncbi:membrane protein insertase YidC [Tersicoccus phoenicis]|uniref:Membrane protein insertase YidC n=1 Tax=Tersicoccus phoenicis TaxID=554083 RepID=A0A1R1L6Y7_9MICC|nr:membrane protein insertase YidC [Tersicoccus phoenicis]OMH23308.1 membrane protein insertase YidC [Tersicoccus phoenicis]